MTPLVFLYVVVVDFVIRNRSPMQIMHRNAFREYRDLVFHRNDAGGRRPTDDILDVAAAPVAKFRRADASRWLARVPTHGVPCLTKSPI